MSTFKVFCSVVALTLASLTTHAAIYPMTGAMKKSVPTGISVGGLTLSLVYDTTIKAQGNALGYGFAVPANSFGSLWSSSFHHQLQVAGNRMTALVSLGDGQVFNFSGNTAVFYSSPGNPHKLEILFMDVNNYYVQGYRFTNALDGTVEDYGLDGRILSRTDANGLVLWFSYSNSNLTQVSASDGRSIRFIYTNNLISQITGSDGQSITATYDTNANLTSLIWQDGTSRQFLYELVTPPPGVTPLVWAMTGEKDENNVRVATWGYDASGRATSSELAGGVGKYSVTYGLPPEYSWADVYDPNRDVIYRRLSQTQPTETVVTLPNGQSVGMNADLSNGAIVLAGKSQPAGSGCSASASAVIYDANGNIARKDDFNGTRSCFVNDLNRNLPLVSVAGLPNTTDCASVLPTNGTLATLPANSRKVSTQYHPDLTLATKTAMPRSITTRVYNGQSDPFNGDAVDNCAPTAAALSNGKPLVVLCKQVTQATSDPDGSLGLMAAIDATVPLQTSTFTYDEAGRILTGSDPAGRTITYAYYANTVMNDQQIYPRTGISTALLLHGDEANGNVKISTTQSMFGGSSLYFDGVNSHLDITPSTDLTFDTSDYTVEFWVKFNAVGAYRRLVSSTVGPFGAATFNVRLNPDNRFFVYNGGAAGVSSSVVATTGVWYHVAVTRQTGTMRLFVNGTLQGSEASSNSTTEAIKSIGGYYAANNSEYHNGYLDEVRITKGQALYTSDFTPPAQAFPDPVAVVVNASDTGHTVGDLQSITNPAGQVTTFNLYDRAGRVRQSTDPKGVVTQVTYTPRGWVSSVTTTAPGQTARLTTYTYDAVGQLTGILSPDGTSTTMSYDPAHRLIGASDAKGNSVAYTLDNMGNRIVEQIKDPQGVLQLQMQRSFDALNRVQQVKVGAP